MTDNIYVTMQKIVIFEFIGSVYKRNENLSFHIINDPNHEVEGSLFA